MTLNPCCIPLKTGVRMVTHLSMALALCVGWSSLKLMSISLEVSTEIATTTSTESIKRLHRYHHNPSEQPNPNLFDSFGPLPPPPLPPTYNNNNNFRSHQTVIPQLSPQEPYPFRIPYDYILFHNWYQQQQQLRHHHNLNQPQWRQPSDTISSFYDQEGFRSLTPISPSHNRHNHHHHLQHHHQVPRNDDDDDDDEEVRPFHPPSLEHELPHEPPPPPPYPPRPPAPVPTPPVSSNSNEKGHEAAAEDDDDEQSKLFRTILHHRKNYQGGRPLPPEEPDSGAELLRKLKEKESKSSISSGNSSPPPSLPTPSPRVQEDERAEERGHVPMDWTPFFLQDEKQVGSSSSSSSSHHIGHHLFSPEEKAAQLSARQDLDSEELNRRRRTMMMMSTFTRDYSPRDDDAPSPTSTGYYVGTPDQIQNRRRTHSSNNNDDANINNISSSPTLKKQSPDFKEQYAKVLLVCGLLALCTVIFQFFTSFLLLCFVDKGSNAAAQIWTAVNCSVIFCLATCLVLFLCEGMSIAKYSFDETLYLSLVTVDSLLSIYFLWVVMAFI